MRLKLYRAADMAEAMARIRAELGADALILSQRRTARGVEVTAALEPSPEEADAIPPLAALPPAREDPLAFHGIPAGLLPPWTNGGLAGALAKSLGFAPLPLEAAGPPLLFVGPPGAGKTLTLARLATRLVLAGRPPLVITADGHRAGAAEELSAFTRLLGLSLVIAAHPVTLTRALSRREPMVPVLIDSPGADAFDPAGGEEVAALAATAGAMPVLVLPAGFDPWEAADQGAAFAALGAKLMVATRLDLARRLGGILAAAAGGRLALAEAGVGPGAANGLVPMTADFLAARLLAPRSAPAVPAFVPADPLPAALPRAATGRGVYP